MFIMYAIFIVTAVVFILALPLGILAVALGAVESWRRDDAQAKLNDLELSERGYQVTMRDTISLTREPYSRINS